VPRNPVVCCPQQGILGADIGSGALTLEYSEVYKCGSGASRHQIYMTTDEVNFPGRVFRMQFCYIHDANGGNNVKSRSERNEICYNWIEGAYYHELELIGSDPGGVDDGWSIGLKREDSDVVGNVLCKRKTAADNDPDFSVTRCGGDATGWTNGRYRFVNNTIIAGSGAVFRLFDTLESIEMHNNIFYRSGGGVNMIRAAEGEMAWTTGKAVIAGSNNWVVNGSSNVPKEWTGTVTGNNPGFVNMDENDLRPDPASPCVNAGASDVSGAEGFPFPASLAKPLFMPPMTNVSTAGEALSRPENGAIDIGAYEYSANATIAQRSRIRQSGGVNILAAVKGNDGVRVSFMIDRTLYVEVRLFDPSGRCAAYTSCGMLTAGEHTSVLRRSQQTRTPGLGIVECRGEGIRCMKVAAVQYCR